MGRDHLRDLDRLRWKNKTKMNLREIRVKGMSGSHLDHEGSNDKLCEHSDELPRFVKAKIFLTS
jgi:hypothetical protein